MGLADENLRHGAATALLYHVGACLRRRVDIDFLSGPARTGTFREPTAALVTEKQRFGASRRSRWFGHPDPTIGP